MSEQIDIEELRKSDLFPDGGNGSGSREIEELKKRDLFPVDDVGPIVSDRLPINDDSIETALEIAQAEGPEDLGGGLRLEPWAGGKRPGLFITKNGESVGRVSDLSPEDKKRILEYLKRPGPGTPGMNDLKPTD